MWLWLVQHHRWDEGGRCTPAHKSIKTKWEGQLRAFVGLSILYAKIIKITWCKVSRRAEKQTILGISTRLKQWLPTTTWHFLSKGLEKKKVVRWWWHRPVIEPWLIFVKRDCLWESSPSRGPWHFRPQLRRHLKSQQVTNYLGLLSAAWMYMSWQVPGLQVMLGVCAQTFRDAIVEKSLEWAI